MSKQKVKQPHVAIDKGVPIPEIQDRGRPWLFPAHKLEVGDSFLIRGGEFESRRQAQGVLTRARTLFPNRQFCFRTVEGGVRVWRIEDKASEGKA